MLFLKQKVLMDMKKGPNVVYEHSKALCNVAPGFLLLTSCQLKSLDRSCLNQLLLLASIMQSPSPPCL